MELTYFISSIQKHKLTLRMRNYFLILFVLFHSAILAQGEVIIKDDFTKNVLGKELEVYHDKSGLETIESVTDAPFIENTLTRPNLGFITGAAWVRTRVVNKSNFSLLYIIINQPLIDTLEIFVLNENDSILSHYIVGEAFSKRTKSNNIDRNFIVPFFPEVNSELSIYMRIATSGQTTLPVYIATDEATWRMARDSNLLFGAYFGIIIVMLFYNLFIYLSVKDVSYLYYVIYVFFMGLTHATLEGFPQFYLWPESPTFANHSLYIFTSLVSYSALIFLREFLKTRVYAPRLHKTSNFLLLYFGFLFLLSVFLIHPIITIASQLGVIITAVFVFITSIVVFRTGYTPANFFLLAWSFLLLSVIIFALKDAGLIASNPITNYAVFVGSGIEVVLLSLALADRINILKKEKEESQEKALRIAQENEVIVKEQNIRLAQRVTARTLDLESANRQLSITLSNLQEAQSQLINSEKMASLGQLTAGIAHEINNPINYVMSNVSPLKQDIEDVLQILNTYDSIRSGDEFDLKKEEVDSLKAQINLEYVRTEINQLLDGIEDGAKRTAEIVKGMKDYSRVDKGEIKSIDINASIESALVLLRSTVTSDIEIHKSFGDLPNVACIPGKINQVFINIANNAIQSLEQNATTTAKQLKIKSWHSGDFVYISFEDNGEGIAAANKNKIFEPFYTSKEVGKGTGLGLSISFTIIEKHNGTISVESEPGKQTVFTVKLPVHSRIQITDY